MPELSKIQSGTAAEPSSGELIYAKHGHISLSVGLHGSFKIAQDTAMNFRTLRGRDLKLIKGKDYDGLHQRTTELKRMLVALMQKLNAER